MTILDRQPRQSDDGDALKRVKIAFYAEPELLDKLDAACKADKRTRSAFIRRAIDAALDRSAA